MTLAELGTFLYRVGRIEDWWWGHDPTATALALAPCAIGAGDPELFARASGIDRHEERAIGEFALGRPAERTVQASTYY